MSSERASDLFLRGVAAAQANDKEEARFYLEWALREWELYGDMDYDQQAEAYLWLSRASDDPQQKREYLESALAVNPSHPEARRDLAIMDGRLKPEDIVDLRQPLKPVESSAAPSSSEVRRYVCPQCGGKMSYNAISQTLSCEYCGRRMSAHEANAQAVTTGHDFVSTIYTARAHRWELATARTLTCQGCGARFTLPPAVVTGSCPFCSSAHVVTSEAERELIEPDGVVPFQFNAETAIQHARGWLAAKTFRPEDLNKQVTLATPRPIYLPFWCFRVGGELKYRGWILEEPLDDKPRRVKMDNSHIISEENVLVPASHTLPAELLEALADFDLKALVPYSTDFLANWPAEIYQVAMAEASLVARQRVVERAREDVRHRSLAGENVHDLVLDSTSVLIESFKLVLLPVWMIEYTYKGQRYALAVNGQSGEVKGEVPRSGLQKLMAGILGDE